MLYVDSGAVLLIDRHYPRMVFFNCNACGESLKKNQVEKHYLSKCRRCEVLSCVDCGKEFWGDSYQTHTKCISEEEKYSGKNFVAKVNKGEVKQEQWIQKVQSAIQKASADPQLKNVLKRLEEFPNVPRKKAKFQNFLKCSMRVFDSNLHNAVWDLLMAEAVKNGNSGNTTPNNAGPDSSTNPQENGTSPTGSDEKDVEDASEFEKKLSKRERKEERRKTMHKAEKKDKQTADGMDDEDGGKSRKKGKRRREHEDEEETEESEVVSQPNKKKKKENGETLDTSVQSENGNASQSEEDTAQTTSGKRGRFDWAHTITAVLRAKGEISLKKLRKKVLAEYASYGGNKPDEKLLAKFNKKVTSLPQVKVLKDRARLVT